nr:MAG TPA: hypothetical protein [Bacteriophage sp.]
MNIVVSNSKILRKCCKYLLIFIPKYNSSS